MKRPKLPKVGDVVEVDWLDSGLSTKGLPDGSHEDSLTVSRCYGRVVKIHDDERLKVPKWMDRTTLWIVHDGGPKDDHAHLGAVWWPCVVSCRVLQ